MNIFIGEYVCGGGYSRRSLDQIPASQRMEGMAMLKCVAADFARFADSVHLAIDSRFDVELPPGATVHRVAAETPLWPQWIEASRSCDTGLLIAPESEGVLAQCVAMLQSTGLRLLNGFGDFLRSASDKWETARVFAAAGVPHPPTWTLESLPDSATCSTRRWVVKPRDGCGTGDVVTFTEFADAVATMELPGRILQPWIEGRAASVSMIVDAKEITILPAVSQTLTAEDCVYRGGQGPLNAADQRRAASLARVAVRALPRTVRGFIGFDLVLADDPAQDCVIEVNPRLTTSYVGLRHIVDGNLAARLAGLDRSPVRAAVEPNSVCWSSAGEVWFV
ncbi:ATP-grasp domain-containing protein [Candidatus Laterigemmans baculatus]|uniref:ATP-grasp domain-containing protein n=1 Tax=Candidatus Laterigemmans baculatus TaxID=2770505 RepID=UPI0013DA464B|nr:ATP-grasp domain-containing protein [Candidatus Laterigemmans baculatus]